MVGKKCMIGKEEGKEKFKVEEYRGWEGCGGGD